MATPVHVIKSSFSGGEFAPSLYARVDIQKYATGARKLRNFFVHPHGGISNRPGFKKIAATKKDNSKARVVDFQFSADENYIIEFGDYYCRFFTEDGAVEKETGDTWLTTTTYSLYDITWASGVIYSCLQDHTSGTFATDLAANKWTIDINKWIATTSYAAGIYAAVTLGTATPTIYFCIQAHTSGTAFTAGTAWLGQTIYEVVSPYSEDDIFALRFAQSADVLFIAHPDFQPRELTRYGHTDWEFSLYDFLNGPFRLGNDDTTLTMQLSTIATPATLTAAATYFYPTHEGALIQLNHYIEGQATAQAFTKATEGSSIKCGGTWRVISHGTWTGKFQVQKSTNGTDWTTLRQFSSVNDFNVDTYGTEDMSDGVLPFLLRATSQNPTTGTFTGTLNVDLTADPYTHQGVAKITEYLSSSTVAVDMQRVAGSTATTIDWAEGAWSDYRGWPSCVVFSQDRLIFAGTYYDPQTIWMTQTGDYYNFLRNDPLVASDGITINLPSQKLNAINGLVSLLQLLAFTSGSEWSIGSTENSVLSPLTIQTRANGYNGSSGIQPCIISNRAIYVQSRGAVVRDLGYELFTDTFSGANISILSNHLFFNHNIIEMAYQQEPDSLVWAVRDDGILLSMTYMREQEVLAWSWHDTNEGDDLFESVCVMPAGGYIPPAEDDYTYGDRNTRIYAPFNGDDTAIKYTALTFQDFIFEGTVQLDTAQKKFGGSSLMLDGNSDYLYIPYNYSYDWVLTTIDFTLEAQVRFSIIQDCCFVTVRESATNLFKFTYTASTDKLTFTIINTGVTASVSCSFNPSLNTWYHIAFVRNGTTAGAWFLFIDAVKQTVTEVGSMALAIPTMDDDMVVGCDGNGANFFAGWMDEFRLSWVARWTDTFTARTEAYHHLCLYDTDVNKVHIRTAAQLQAMEDDLDGDYVLDNDIDLTGVDWQPIGSTAANAFTGTFNGRGHTISNLTTNGTTGANEGLVVGLFGYIGDNTDDKDDRAVVKNFNLENVVLTGGYALGSVVGFILSAFLYDIHVSNVTINSSDDWVPDFQSSGGFAGDCFTSNNLDTIVRHCDATDVTMNCSAEATIEEVDDCGGFMGTAYDATNGRYRIDYCFAKNVTIATDDAGATDTGGFIGNSIDAIIRNCYVENVNLALTITAVANYFLELGGFAGLACITTRGEISKCYATGQITLTGVKSGQGDAEDIGGFIGFTYEGSIQDCYTTVDVDVVNGDTLHIGGFAGYPGAPNYTLEIQNCYAIGAITLTGCGDADGVGGFAGRTRQSSLINCYSVGAVDEGTAATTVYVGGFIGILGTTTLTNCSWATASYLVAIGNKSGATVAMLAGAGYGTDEDDATDFYLKTHAVYTGVTPWNFTNATWYNPAVWLEATASYPTLNYWWP